MIEDYVLELATGYIDSVVGPFSQGEKPMVDVNGYSVCPEQTAVTLNQPLFLHTPSGQWCRLAGVSGYGLIIQTLDGKLNYNVSPLDVANVGIQA